MPDPDNHTIIIRARTSYHANVTILIGVTLLSISTWLASIYWQQAHLVMIFIIMVSIVTIFIGLMKKLEPKESLTLTPATIYYHHRYGHWQLPWSAIRRTDRIRVLQGLDHREFPYFGIQLNDLDELINTISLRLANRLIHEQRGLLIAAVQSGLMTMEQATINFEPYQFKGQTIKGPKAAFLYQVDALKQAYGYHLFIPFNSVHLTPDEFTKLLAACHRASLKYQA